ncbi:PEP-CTERM sorting domain-containing protein [Methylomonas sp. SURF-2]|uniref:PEP-CTERM sorting domain-containing protein n=1 Tax=Methylomonas subterranea TaxID=2952225 RepID=A0ABT1TI50_9GAMM|nr:EDSAP-1 family PEP-CTERM protein [Methylomonas sp. SURF-2]MCQ8105133.1 PEP-CTERM sorting domain-containing protein [Methylomonas sp. SURF-2]
MKHSTLQTTIKSIILGISIAGTAQAGSLASAVVTIDNFTISRNGTAVDYNQFSSLNFTSSSDVSATLDGVNSNNSASSSNGGLIDLYASQGTPGPANNSFPELTAGSGVPGPIGSNYAVADTYEFGSPISGLPSGTPLFTDDTGAQATFLGVASYVSLTGTGDGSAQSNNSLQALFSFSLNEGGALDFTFDVNPFVETYLETGGNGSADASFSVVFSLLDLAGNSLLDASSAPFFINPITGEFVFGSTRSSGAPGTGISNQFGAGGPITLSFSTLNLTAGTQYQLSARMNATADAVFIPEPETLALLGIGLLGIAFNIRKKAPIAA